jgi:hypothetical protein
MRYRDGNDELNSAAHHSGRRCVEKGCKAPAGTAWSPFWCFEHNVERMDRISANLEAELAYREGRR